MLQFLRVREAVCVVGRDREAVSYIKNQVGQLQEEPFPIEGFHVKVSAAGNTIFFVKEAIIHRFNMSSRAESMTGESPPLASFLRGCSHILCLDIESTM